MDLQNMIETARPTLVAFGLKVLGAIALYIVGITTGVVLLVIGVRWLVREPVLNVHNDYTEWSGPQRVRDLLPGEAEDLLKRRFAIIQVWRAINQPIQSNPLAIADARSLAPRDLIRAERRYPNRVGETYQRCSGV